MYCRNKANAFLDTTKVVIICVLTNVHESWPVQNAKKQLNFTQISFLSTTGKKYKSQKPDYIL